MRGRLGYRWLIVALLVAAGSASGCGGGGSSSSEKPKASVAGNQAAGAFKQTPFDKLVDRLPIRRAPLYVEQTITTEGSHTVYTAVAKRRFICSMSARQRLAAVKAYYRDARDVFRSGGVKDFVQVVTPQSDRADNLPALAVAKAGSVSLTPRGRARARC